MAATAHLPANQPTGENELPQGVKNWDKPPQQVDGPEGPEPHPIPEEAGAGRTNSDKKPQQVQAAKSYSEVSEPPPTGDVNDDPKPQHIDGPEGPEPTDGTELNAAVESQVPGEQSKGGPVAVKAKRKPAPAKAAEDPKESTPK